jgi:hypothetical protein
MNSDVCPISPSKRWGTREHAAASLASVSDIAEHALNIYEPRCTAAGITIKKSISPSTKIVLRRGEMMQVTSNLIVNSIYATGLSIDALIWQIASNDLKPRRAVLPPRTSSKQGLLERIVALYQSRQPVLKGSGDGSLRVFERDYPVSWLFRRFHSWSDAADGHTI